jgi:hypothetical protein
VQGEVVHKKFIGFFLESKCIVCTCLFGFIFSNMRIWGLRGSGSS